MTDHTPDGSVRVVQGTTASGLVWRALDRDVLIGEVTELVRPDGKRFLQLGACRDDAYRPLLSAMRTDLPGPLFVSVDEVDTPRLSALARLGFQAVRHESDYSIPVDVAWERLGTATAPDGVELRSAAEVDPDRLRQLDDDLRQDVPGTDGWRWDPGDFLEQTFDASAFDPALYWIAIYDGQYVGLVRVWDGPSCPRLGLVAVSRGYRRGGLARALLARAFRTLHARGVPAVDAEADDGNDASVNLLKSLGAERTGGSVELVSSGPATLAR